MKNIMILVGAWPNHIINELALFDLIEKTFHGRIQKKDAFAFDTVIKNTKVTFQFCLGHDNDPIVNELKKQTDAQIPPHIKTLAQKKLDIDEVYYLGFCGHFKGGVNYVYVPHSFKKVIFNRHEITSRTPHKLIKRALKFKNLLHGKIGGTECVSLTSNHVHSLRYATNNNERELFLLGKKLGPHADVIEREGYEMVKLFGRKYPLGIAYYGTDSALEPHSLISTSRNQVDWKEFKKVSLDMIRAIT